MELRRLNTYYNPTAKVEVEVEPEVIDCAFIGTMLTVDEPTTFEEAWNHHDPVKRKKWREAVKQKKFLISDILPPA